MILVWVYLGYWLAVGLFAWAATEVSQVLIRLLSRS